MAPGTTNQPAALEKAILELDPTGEYVKLDSSKRVVTYSSKIRQNELIADYVGYEEPVRAYFVAWLCTRGGYDPAALELEKRYNFGRESHSELDIRIAQPEDSAAYALIELKAPHDFKGSEDQRIEGQLFAPAGAEPECHLLCLATVIADDGGNQPEIRTVTIAYDPALTYTTWTAGGRSHVADFPVNYNEPTQIPLAPDTGRDLRTNVSIAELDRLRRQLHDRLWGGSRDDNQIYSWLVKLFLTKILDEKLTDAGKPYVFQVLHEGSSKERPRTTLRRLNERYIDAHKRYITSTGRIDPLDESLFSAQETQWVVELLQSISLTAAGRTSGDLLGAFFEAITRDNFKQSKGLFFTHYNLAVFMLEALEVPQLAEAKLASNAHPNERLPYIIDPSCGSGTFLLAAMRLVTEHLIERRVELSRNRDVREQLELRLPSHAPNTWAKDFIYGIEKREDLSVSTKVNMVLHQDGHTHIAHDDALSPLTSLADRHREPRFRSNSDPDALYDKPVAESFDVVVTNPPFSLTLDDSIRKLLSTTFCLANENNSENLFLERWYQLLKHRGRLAAVLPESFFSTTENLRARLFLFRHFSVRAVVSLPSHAFQPWTPTRTSLLFARKKTPAEERHWSTIFDQHLASIEGLLAAVATSARKIMIPGRRATPETLVQHRERLVTSLQQLGVVGFDETGQDAAWAQGLGLLAKEISPGALAFQRTIPEVGISPYLGISVSDVGYRRTRRGESARMNDMFWAIRQTDEGEIVPVRNLNGAPPGWRVEAEQPDTALAIMRQAKLWD